MYVGIIPKYDLFLNIGTVSNATLSDEGIMRMRSVTSSTLIFAIPYALSILLCNKKPYFLKIKKFTYLIIVILGFIGIFLTGRRALFLTTILSFFCVYLFSLFLPKNNFKNILRYQVDILSKVTFPITIILSAFFYYNDFDIFKVLSYLSSFNLNSEVYRTTQAAALFNGFNEYIFLGKGHGAVADIIRSDKPWRYELSYLSLLFHTGIIGTILYSIGFFWIYLRGLKIVSFGGQDAINMIALLNGFTAMTIAYATNPYFDALDILWVIFIPISFINIVTKEKFRY